MSRSPGDVVRQTREHSRLSKTDFAVVAGTSRGALDQIEKGERDPRVATLAGIAAAGGLRLDLRLVDPNPQASDEGLASATQSLDVSDPRWAWRWLIGDFVANTFVPASRAARVGLLHAAPCATGSSRWDSFIDALAEHLCVHGQMCRPSWLSRRAPIRDQAFWWPVHGDLPSQRAAAMAFSPASFKRRHILLDGREIPEVLP